MQLIVKSNSLDIHEDCNFSSKVIHKLSKDDPIIKLANVGLWMKISYKEYTGWVYPFNSKDGFCIVDKDLIKENSIKVGSVCTIKSNTGDLVTYRDKHKRVLTVVEDKTSLYFSIVGEASNGYVYIRSRTSDKQYEVKKSDITIIEQKADHKFYSSNAAEPNGGGGGKFLEDKSFGDKTADFFNQRFSNSDIEKIQDSVNTYFYSKNSESLDNVVTLTKINLNSLRSIFGMPYQYLPVADLRVKSTGVGYESSTTPLTDISAIGIKYREKILSRMPFCIFMPGMVDFMPNYNSAEKEDILKGVVDENSGWDNLRKVAEGKTRGSYYNFYPAYSLYYRYVNAICRMAAIFMGVGDRVVYGNTPLSKFDWRSLSPDTISKSSFYHGSVLYYLNTENQISESFSNSTTQSQLAQKTNAVSEQARELMFLSNTAVDVTAAASKVASSAVSSGLNNTQQLFDNIKAKVGSGMSSSQGAVAAILNGLHNTIAGSKMLFPELWQDSQFSRDYSVNVKFGSPDNDPLSIYLNIIVPLIHTVCLAAPKYTGPNTYTAPFLVRAFYQGFFNVNMGIITDLSITKGNEGAWTYDNVPTTLELRISIKDLFGTNFMSMGQNENNMDLNVLSNQPFVDYIANTCGINIDEPDYPRAWKMMKMIFSPEAKVKDTVRSVREAFFETYTQATARTYGSIIGLHPGNIRLFDLVTIGTGQATQAILNKINK